MDDDLHPIALCDLKFDEPVELAHINYVKTINTPLETIHDNIRVNCAMGLPELQVPIPAHDRTLTICGSAPSLVQNTSHIVGDILACNRAIAVLEGMGRRVTYPMIWDASLEVVTHARMLPHATWLIASRVSPVLTKLLLSWGQAIRLWHADGDGADLAFPHPVPMIEGGGQAVPRAVFIGYAMGYRTMRILGADSSFLSQETHVEGSVRKEDEVLVRVGDGVYRTTFWMANQADEWQHFILPWCARHGVTLTVHGEGLLPDVHNLWMTRNGGDTRHDLGV